MRQSANVFTLRRQLLLNIAASAVLGGCGRISTRAASPSASSTESPARVDTSLGRHAELARFLAHAKATTYAADDDSKIHPLHDGGSEAHCERGSYRYRDRWYGGARFAGQELVWHEERLVWCLNFHGATSPDATPAFFHFHKRALRHVPAEVPLRGPPLYRDGPFAYVNDWSGSLEAFNGVERAFAGLCEVFRLYYHGGLLA